MCEPVKIKTFSNNSAQLKMKPVFLYFSSVIDKYDKGQLLWNHLKSQDRY